MRDGKDQLQGTAVAASHGCGRLEGSALAIAVALVAAPVITALGFVAWDYLGAHTDRPDLAFLVAWTAFAAVTAGIGGWTVAPIVTGGRGHGIGEVCLMALVTYISGVLLAPIVTSVAALPGVLNGGDVPCNGLSHYQFQCPSGLHGSAAIGALIGSAGEAYSLTLVALLIFLPLAAALLVPAGVWDVMVRRRLK